MNDLQQKGWEYAQKLADRQSDFEQEVAKDLFEVWGKGANNYHLSYDWDHITDEMQQGYLALARYIIAGGFTKDRF